MSKQANVKPKVVSPELCLLLDCLWDPNTKPDVSGVDWEAFIRLARKHRCVPLVQAGLARHDLPINERLKSLTMKIGLSNANLTEVLNGIQQKFETKGIRVSCVKGPALSLQAYGNIASRQFGDLDLVVSQADLSRAVRLLILQGFALREVSSLSRLDAVLSAQRGASLQNAERTVYIDIGSVVISYALSPKAMEEAVLGESIAIRVDEKRDILAPGPELMMMILCMHGAEDMWDKLGMVADVAALVRSHPEIDWAATLVRARSWGQGRAMLVGLCLARDLLDITLPEGIERELQRERVATALAAEAMQHLLSGQSLETATAHRARFELRTRERLRDRCRWLIRRLFVPGVAVMNWIYLPRGLRFLYYFLRPFRLARRLIGLR